MDQPLRFVTAASLFDGHDASINIMRRILQAQGAEVIHLGHDRSVQEIAAAAIEEDVHGVAISSYQGGHMEFFSYLKKLLEEAGRGELPIFGGGGGTITAQEIATLHERGIRHIYSVEDGRRMGLEGMIQHMVEAARRDLTAEMEGLEPGWQEGEFGAIARSLSWIEDLHARDQRGLLERAFEGLSSRVPVLGLTGVGGAGKSSLTDELLRRLLQRFPERRFAVLSMDPSRRRSGGALLGDRIRMNALNERVFMRSMATRTSHSAISNSISDALAFLKSAPFDLILFETAGIGQSSSEVVDLADLSLYVMTPEFGAPSQLEKIDMLDYADLVALNKADKRGAEDAERQVAKQIQRNRGWLEHPLEEMPVQRCSANRFGDPGVDALFEQLLQLLDQRLERDWSPAPRPKRAAEPQGILPPRRARYLSEVADVLRAYRDRVDFLVGVAAEADGLARSLKLLGLEPPEELQPFSGQLEGENQELINLYNERLARLHPDARELLRALPKLREGYSAPEYRYTVRGREIRGSNYSTSLSGTQLPKVSLPRTKDWGALLRWGMLENLPGHFPYTAGVFPYKRTGEDPSRMFAGEGHPERTNRRFHYLSRGQKAARLSTAFDSVTLYGRDPARRPDIYGKVGNSGVSVATLDDAKRLYSGFDLCAPSTSVSMTINGPAPMLLAMFFNAAIDQAVERRLRETGRWAEAEAKIEALLPERPSYRGALPQGHDGSGLGLLGVTGDQLLPPKEYAEIKAAVLQSVRGTVQADILKEDQAQNTCIFSTESALKMMGDIQEWFLERQVRNFYSVSISGYHIAEAGANPITQLALTLANGFTYVEYYRARGMEPDAFARNLSFFFSNGVDAEYAVIGRVARRIWSVAMRDMYGAGPRGQMLKYHIQTSGRSLHAQEVDFNDIRTTLQALYALSDNCNSLHTNAYDEAITTPTEASVRRALAIQMIINQELGLMRSENPLQGSYFLEWLSDEVERAVLAEFDRISERGGVLGAMELMYQRGRIQEESLLYEHQKHSGALPIIGVNTFLAAQEQEPSEPELIRASKEEKRAQLLGVEAFQRQHIGVAAEALAQLRQVAEEGGNLFAELMETVKCCSLGQISEALFNVGGQYRRNM